jgi:hypothetical protein
MTGYNQPLNRTSFLNFTAVNGYTTARMMVALPTGTITSLNVPYGSINFQLENLGDVSTTLQIKQAASQDPTSGRTAITDAVALTPRGFATVSACPTRQFVEVWCTAGGPAQIRGQISTKLDYTLAGFTQSGTKNSNYPPVFWQAEYPPTL